MFHREHKINWFNAVFSEKSFELWVNSKAFDSHQFEHKRRVEVGVKRSGFAIDLLSSASMSNIAVERRLYSQSLGRGVSDSTTPMNLTPPFSFHHATTDNTVGHGERSVLYRVQQLSSVVCFLRFLDLYTRRPPASIFFNILLIITERCKDTCKCNVIDVYIDERHRVWIVYNIIYNFSSGFLNENDILAPI